MGTALWSWVMSPNVPTVRNLQIETVGTSVDCETDLCEYLNEPETVVTTDNTNLKFGKYTLYEVAMYKFIATEGIVLDRYTCDAGYKTFGIGCVNDTPEEEKLIKSGLTYEKVRAHLETEYLKMMERIEKDAPELYKKHEKAALAMLFLSIGYERFWKKNAYLKPSYRLGLGIPINTWLKQCNYKNRKGKWVRSENLYRSKVFETALYKGDVKTVLNSTKRFHSDAITIQKRLDIWRSKQQSKSDAIQYAGSSR